MSVSNGQLANQTTFNDAFASKQINNSLAGIQTFSNVTNSSSTSTGALILSGGIGLAGNLYCGGNLVLTGTFTQADGTESTNPATGAVVLAGGLGVGKNLQVGGAIVAVGAISGSNLSGTNTGDVSVGTFGAVGTAAGLTLTGQSLAMSPATATAPGGVSILAQTFGGDKTFQDTLTAAGIFNVKTKNVPTTAPADGQILQYKSGPDTIDNAKAGGYQANAATESIAASGSVTKLAAGYGAQYLRVQGNAGAQVASNTPLGSLAGYESGTVFVLAGRSDTNTLRVNHADVQYGALLNGDKILGLADELTLVYDADLERLIEPGMKDE